MEQEDSYLVVFPIPEPHAHIMRSLMDMVFEYTRIPPPYHDIPPYITIQQPIPITKKMGVYGAIYTLITHIAPCELSTKRFLSYFGETHIALPVEETARTIQMKDLIRRAFQGLSEITHEDESIPHTIVGKIFKDKCDTAWDTIQKIPIQEMTISIKTIELYKKVATQCIWEKIDEFPLRPRTQ